MVYSTTSRESFLSIDDFREQIKRVKDSGNTTPSLCSSVSFPLFLSLSPCSICSISKDLHTSDSFPLVIVGNKSDLGEEREVSTEEGLAGAQRIGGHFIEASAKVTCFE